jgi:AraC-like DNA-binding protein
MLLVHPDLLLSYPLAKGIKQYGFFSYAANEALHLSDQERTTIMTVFQIIDEELNSRIDDFSQDVIVSQIELLRTLTGQNAQQLIHQKLVEKAKGILSTSDLSVAEIAYQLGFEHPQSFTRLFKSKTQLLPVDFRLSFN